MSAERNRADSEHDIRSTGSSAPPAGTRADQFQLVLGSFLILFLELVLIRWTASNVVYLSYFSNFVLLGSFLGIGLGFVLRGRVRSLFPVAPWVLAALVIFVRRFQVSIDRQGAELIFFGSGSSGTTLPTWVMLPILFVSVAVIFMCVAHGVATLFAKFKPLHAYALDISGSLLGIVAFTAASFLRADPRVWALVVAACIALMMTPKQQLVAIVPIAVVVVAMGLEARDPQLSWSPYYKVRAIPNPSGLNIQVNGIPHQAVTSAEHRRRTEPIYLIPYARAQNNPLDDVLVVGAGNGTDVAIALKQGAKRVDAVEIDPRLYEIGRRSHPDRPYSNQGVTVHINDGRAFLEQTSQRYDLILFALPDSLTLVAGQSSLRLESYLFTQEALALARDRLKPGGAFAMYNFYRERWLVDRLANTLATVFGRPPCLDLSPQALHLAAMTVAQTDDAVRCDQTWAPATVPKPSPATDDYPFLYLQSRHIPGFYLATIALILMVSFAATRAAAGPFTKMRPYADLFFMGVAFLLLETKSVVQFALLFGTTWLVNSLVFAGVLLSVLLAVALSMKVRIRAPQRLYVVLIAFIALSFVVPSSALLGLPVAPRFLAAILLAFSPIFVANLVFAERFARVENATTAFGANLLGAMVGGTLEYLSLLTGYRVLLLVVAVIYGLAFFTGRRDLNVVRS